MTKLLFIDRDGCLIAEPQPSQQVDSLDKLEFIPGAIYALARIARELQYELVMVTNQDGLGTESFPEEHFWPAQNKMLQTLAGEGVHFRAVHIDRSFPHENLPTRKPGTAMLTEYLQGDFDLANSYVIGDRLTDMQLAKNMGAKGILIRNTSAQAATQSMAAAMPEESLRQYDPKGREKDIALIASDWEEIYQFLRIPGRRVTHRRTTRETDITVTLNLDGSGNSQILTGIGFFDHMLEQVSRHSALDLSLEAQGDLHIDQHHTIEDTALTLGEAFSMALQDKRGLERYGYAAIPMDDAMAQVAIDFGGRPSLVWHAEFNREKVGSMPTEMFYHFFKSFSDAARCNLHIRCEGENEHHKIEAIFKAFARAVKMAKMRNVNSNDLPSTKGWL